MTAKAETLDWHQRYAASQAMLLAADRVANGVVYPHWSADGRHVWYRRRGEGGLEIRLVDTADGTMRTLFLVSAIADRLADHFGTNISPEALILANLSIDAAASLAEFRAYGAAWRFDIAGSRLELRPDEPRTRQSRSPDGHSAIELVDNNLLMAGPDNEQRCLTTDGTPLNAYASPPAALRSVMEALGAGLEGLWSPDGTWFLTIQTDDRHVPDLPFIEYAPAEGLRPKVRANPTSLPADTHPPEFRLLAIEVTTGRLVEARYPRIPAVRMNDTPFAAGRVWWSADSRTAWFVDVERGERTAHVVALDIESGGCRTLFSEMSETYVELGPNVYAPGLIYPLPDTNELIWYSERSGNGHLYLYDLETGLLKRPITSGNWRVAEVLAIDARRRELWVAAAGFGPGDDPQQQRPVRFSLDEEASHLLSGAAGDHIVWRPGQFALLGAAPHGIDQFAVAGVAPDCEAFVATIGRPDALPQTLLANRDGDVIAVLEQPEEHDLPADWQWPERFAVPAADGTTMLYGLLFPPLAIGRDTPAPVIDLVYGGPQVSFVPRSAFADGSLATGTIVEAAHLAALGAWVMLVDGRGTAGRERAFREASHGRIEMASNLDDHVAALRTLAADRPGMDLDRVGITGFSGGGYLAALAMLRRGDVYKVGVAGGGNYDQSLFWHGWGERYQGPWSQAGYRAQAARTYADGLKGKLMLVHGLLDSGCHPSALFQLVEAIQQENADVDLVVLPRAGHEWTAYGYRRRADYFVRHLFGGVPPGDVRFELPYDKLRERVAANSKAPTGAING